MAEKLRDLSHPIDVPLLDATVAAFYGTGSKEERTAADQILRELQNNPDMWLQVVHILQNSQNLNTKFFALQLLSEEVFDFSRGEMTQQKIKDLKHSLNRNLTLQCLTEVASLQFGDVYVMQYCNMYNFFMVQLQTILPPGTNIPDLYATGSGEAQSHIRVLESTLENRNALLMGLEYLISISYVDDTEVFKVCLDYWNLLVLELFEAQHNPATTASMMGLQMVDGLDSPVSQRRQLYSGPFSKLRMLMICRMAKPEEVLIVEDENGNIVRETMKDNDVLVQYKMLTKLSKQLNGEDWSWNNLNTLCWAIGSISGSMVEEQDMACDTFLKIVQKCKRKFVQIQLGETEPFVSELLSGLPTTVADLEPHQIHTFYESVGQMIQAECDEQKRDEYLQRLMDLPNKKWVEIIGQARQSVEFLKDQDVIRTVLNILQTNTSVAVSLGPYFFTQIKCIFLDMLNVYRMYSELISNSIAGGGPFASRTSYVKLLRSVKRETLKLIETFIDKTEDQPDLGKQFVQAMMDPVLGDYARNVPDARESEVLSLFATIINKCKATMMEDVPRIFEAVFECTLEQLKLVVDSINWAFRHTERNIAETGLNLLLEMLKNFQVSEFCNQFYRTYYLTIEQEIFAVLTDTFHKPGFKLHVLVLQHLFCLVDSGSLTEPLWDVSTVPLPYPNNMVFVRDYTIKLLGTSFPNMTTTEVTQFVDGLFDSRKDLPTFKDRIRDFLVKSKEFSAQDNKDLYAEEAAVQRERERQRMLTIPGLIAPSELQDEMVDS
ncbi:hypothetical protein QJS10_CPA01g00912 [Acorus calamus]|uniref:Exportin-1 C-terminal domain-containing protein n=1 Tax=Acorus calamus TaxID=4465 RepID=A0AAV9FJV0_ACOCL|nr:hypothetical protein QJS10_CPA01g00912 [Acorus calamus]